MANKSESEKYDELTKEIRDLKEEAMFKRAIHDAVTDRKNKVWNINRDRNTAQIIQYLITSAAIDMKNEDLDAVGLDLVKANQLLQDLYRANKNYFSTKHGKRLIYSLKKSAYMYAKNIKEKYRYDLKALNIASSLAHIAKFWDSEYKHKL